MKIQVFEIGVGSPELSRSLKFFNNPIYHVTMFEPNPNTYYSLVKAFGNINNLTIYNIALFNTDGFIDFVLDGDSSYVEGVMSPTEQCAPIEYINNLKKIKIPCHSIDRYDNGKINVMLLDCEGCEWPIISKMKSRPDFIVIEMGGEKSSEYVNKNFKEIENWISANNYKFFKSENKDRIYTKM